MKSPHTGKPMPLGASSADLQLNGEHFIIIFLYYRCPETEEQYTDEILDTLNLYQVYQQYAEKHKIPIEEVMPNEIKNSTMIKAYSKNGKKIFLGLSDENVRRLQNDQPIKFNLKEFGLEDIDVIIFNGKTEEDMQKKFVEAGLIHPTKTEVRDLKSKDH